MKMTRYSGAGNTFLFADNRKNAFDITQVAPLCARERVDGVILAEEIEDADARMRIFNADGSEAEMCGNGLRCFVHFLKELGLERSIYQIATLAGMHTGWFVNQEVCVQLPPPSDCQLYITPEMHCMNTGVPHAVLFVSDVEKVDVVTLGKNIRNDPLFAPAGTNVNFVSLSENLLTIRTYERGVEAETQACGTGSIAAALIAHKIYHLPSPLTVKVRSGEKLKISFTPNFSEVTLQGSVQRF